MKDGLKMPSRRKFLQNAGILLAGAALGIGGCDFSGNQVQNEINFLEDFLNGTSRASCSMESILSSSYDIGIREGDKYYKYGKAVHIGDGFFLTANHCLTDDKKRLITDRLEVFPSFPFTDPYAGEFSTLVTDIYNDIALIRPWICTLLKDLRIKPEDIPRMPLDKKDPRMRDIVTMVDVTDFWTFIHESRLDPNSSRDNLADVELYYGLDPQKENGSADTVCTILRCGGMDIIEGRVRGLDKVSMRKILQERNLPYGRNIEFASILVKPGYSGSGVFHNIGKNQYSLSGIVLMQRGFEGYTPEPNSIIPNEVGMMFANRDAIHNMIQRYITFTLREKE